MKQLFGIVATIVLAVASLAQAPKPGDKKQLDALESQYKAAKAALAKHPNDQGAKSKFVVAADKYATLAMTSPVMTPHQRYPLALHIYREVLKVDPKNHEASSNKELIEGVYRSMHRPIPK